MSSNPPHLSREQLEKISWIEWYYHDNNGVPPTEAAFKAKFFTSLNDFLSNPLCRQALHNRGIILNPQARELSPEQIAAVMTIANVNDKRSRHSKLRSLGITEAVWTGWLRNPHFKDFLHRTVGFNFENSIDVLQESVVKAVEKGSVDAMRLYLDMTGRTPKTNNQIENIQVILSRIIESIQRHVKEPEKIAAIAADFELIMDGKNPQVIELEGRRI